MMTMTMNIKNSFYNFLLSLLLLQGIAYSQTIAEKKAGMAPAGGDLNRDMQVALVQINRELKEDQSELNILYNKAIDLYETNAPDAEFKDLLARINTLKANIERLENSWREMTSETGHENKYALWHQPETTLGQLIIDYGSQNFVYIMPPEISLIKVSVDSNIPIPRASWNEMMELILTQNGIGIKQLNPYLRQLYFLRHDRSGISLITNSRHDLEYLDPETRIAFMLSPEPMEVRRIWSFLDKFVNPNTTVLQMIGRDILIIAPIAEVLDLLKLYDFIAANKGDKEFRIRTVTRVQVEEMAKILAAIFDQLHESGKINERGPAGPMGGGPPGGPPGKALIDISKDKRDSGPADINGLKIIPLTHIAQALFLVGTREEIKKADEIITQVEEQVGEARQKVIWQYTTKHSDPEDLAQILQKIYTLMIQTGTGRSEDPLLRKAQQIAEEKDKLQQARMEAAAQLPPVYAPQLPNPSLPSKLYQNDFYQQGGYVVNPAPIEPRVPIPQEANKNRNNFIVDLKTGSIVMVVEADILPKMKELIKKLDVPKRMVQIEALVFEKRLMHQDNFGLNLLRIGSGASNQNVATLLWNNIVSVAGDLLPGNAGITDYIISRKGEHGVPAFDLAYRFLINQEDVQINANPTVVTVNQVPAKIAVVDEISINTGIFLVDTVKGITPENAYTRAQYGITIIVTPTIHITDDGSGEATNYVTLDSDITFDTIIPSATQQPTVTRRHITNQVRIPDGQTVVIGGLRRKNTDDVKDSIPYLGEIPGFGKLFSSTTMTDNTLELFIFLTPRIISDPVDDFNRLREEEMCKRPGDIPEFMCCLVEAEEMEKNRLYTGTMNVLFGRPPDRCVAEPEWRTSVLPGEFDGRE